MQLSGGIVVTKQARQACQMLGLDIGQLIIEHLQAGREFSYFLPGIAIVTEDGLTVLMVDTGYLRMLSRDQLIDQMLSARADQEIEAAEKALAEWLAQHPDDTGIRAGAEQLEMIRTAGGHDR